MGLAYLKFHPTSPDPYLCAILPKNYTIVDLATEFWECEEIENREPRIVVNSSEFDKGATIWLGNISILQL